MVDLLKQVKVRRFAIIVWNLHPDPVRISVANDTSHCLVDSLVAELIRKDGMGALMRRPWNALRD